MWYFIWVIALIVSSGFAIKMALKLENAESAETSNETSED